MRNGLKSTLTAITLAAAMAMPIGNATSAEPTRPTYEKASQSQSDDPYNIRLDRFNRERAYIAKQYGVDITKVSGDFQNTSPRFSKDKGTYHIRQFDPRKNKYITKTITIPYTDFPKDIRELRITEQEILDTKQKKRENDLYEVNKAIIALGEIKAVHNAIFTRKTSTPKKKK